MNGRPLLSTVPLGGWLAALLRLGLGAAEREEFLGDLIEEAHLRRARCTRGEVALWLWAQALRSLPALLGLRLRRLLAQGLAGRAVDPARAGAGLLVGPRGGHRGWPVPLAVSLSAHALLVAAVLAWVLGRVDEVKPLAAPPETVATIVSEPEPLLDPPAAAGPAGDPAPVRRLRGGRRPPPVPSPAPAAGPQPGPAMPGAATIASGELTRAAPPAPTAAAAGGGSGVIVLPPRVADKRCLVCPTPQLRPAYARLVRGQDLVVHTCVSSRGQVTSVDVVRGVDSVVDREVTETIRHWRLVPYQLNGHPVPFCYTTRFLFTTG